MASGNLKYYAIVDIADKKKWALNGGPFGSKLVSKDYVQEGVPVIRGTNLSGDTKFNSNNFVYVTEEKANSLLANNAHPGDVIFTQRGTLGQVGIIPDNPKYERFVISQSQMKLTVNPEIAEPLYIYYLFSDKGVSKELENQAFSSGVPHINLTILREFKIPLPSVDHQRKIIKILGDYDNLIENNNRHIAILEDMAQSLYREWFVKFRYPGHENQTLIDSPLGPIPEGWEWNSLSALVKLKRIAVTKGKLPEPTPYMGLEHFPRKSISLSEWEMVSEIGSSKLRFNTGDILFGKIRPYFHKVGVAQTSGLCSSDTFVLEPKDSEHHSLITMVTFSEAFVAHSVQTSQGTKMPRANWDVLKDYLLVIPPSNLLESFNGIVDSAIEQIRVLSSKNRNLKLQRDMLLPKLISGKINMQNTES